MALPIAPPVSAPCCARLALLSLLSHAPNADLLSAALYSEASGREGEDGIRRVTEGEDGIRRVTEGEDGIRRIETATLALSSLLLSVTRLMDRSSPLEPFDGVAQREGLPAAMASRRAVSRLMTTLLRAVRAHALAAHELEMPDRTPPLDVLPLVASLVRGEAEAEWLAEEAEEEAAAE